LLGDDVRRRGLLGEGRELRLGVAFRWRQGGEHVGGNFLVGDEIVEANRVAIAFQPADLSFVRIEMLQPELRRRRMRRERADRLDVDAGDDAALGHDDLDLRIALERVARRERVVIPHDDDRRRALGDRRGRAADRYEVTGLVEIGEEIEPVGRGLGGVAGAAGEARRIDRHRRLVGGAWIADDRHRGLVVRSFEVGPVRRDFLDDVGVHRHRKHAVIVAGPITVGVFGGVGNRGPGRHLVRLDEAVGLGRGTERQTDVDDVGRLRSLIGLVGLDRLDLVARTAVRIELVDGEAILRLEAVDEGAVAAPIVRQGDDGQLSFLLGGGDEIVHPVGERRRSGACERQCRDRTQQTHLYAHHRSPSLRFPPAQRPFKRTRELPVAVSAWI
jgi:hypothetical protein